MQYVLILLLIIVIIIFSIIFSIIIKNKNVTSLPLINYTSNSIEGIVVVGHGLAKNINYPTANLELTNKTTLKPGLYIGTTILKNHKKLNSIFRINRQQDHAFIYLDKFNGDLYGQSLKVNEIYHLENKLIDFIQRYHNFLDNLHNRHNSLSLLYSN